VAADEFRATNKKEYASERELNALERDQLASPPPRLRRFELVSAASELRAGKTLAERVERADNQYKKQCV
jgi:hypothetical protein